MSCARPVAAGQSARTDARQHLAGSTALARAGSTALGRAGSTAQSRAGSTAQGRAGNTSRSPRGLATPLRVR